jgi:hypothetical protein
MHDLKFLNKNSINLQNEKGNCKIQTPDMGLIIYFQTKFIYPSWTLRKHCVQLLASDLERRSHCQPGTTVRRTHKRARLLTPLTRTHMHARTHIRSCPQVYVLTSTPNPPHWQGDHYTSKYFCIDQDLESLKCQLTAWGTICQWLWGGNSCRQGSMDSPGHWNSWVLTPELCAPIAQTLPRISQKNLC